MELGDRVGSERLGPLVESASTHIDGGPSHSDVTADDQARIRHQFLEAGHDGVFLCETRSPGIAADPLQHVGMLESNPARDTGEDRRISAAGPFESPAPRAGAEVEKFLEQRGVPAGSSRHGMDHDGGSLEGPDLESSNRGAGRAAGKTWATDALIAETIELHKLVNLETIFRFQSLKELTKAPQMAWVQLALEISTRGQGIRAWDLVQSWIGCAAFHTLGCRLRRERGGLSSQARSLRW